MDKAKFVRIVMAGWLLMAFLVSCSAEIGSEAWCKELKAKPKGDWSANEAADFTKHCIFK